MNAPERVRDFTYRRVSFHSFKNMRHQILGSPSGFVQTVERLPDYVAVASQAHVQEALNLASFDCGITKVDRNLLFLIDSKFIHSDDNALFLLDRLLIFVCGFMNLTLYPSVFDSRQHTSSAVNLLEILRNFSLHLIGQGLNRVRSPHGIDGVDDARLVRNDLLSSQRQSRCIGGWNRESFIFRIGMQRLCAAQYRSQCLNRDTNDVVVWLLCGQRRTCSLRMESKHPRPRIFCAKAISHQLCPNATRRTEFGDFFEEVIVRVKEKGNSRCERINIKAPIQRGLHVRDRVRECERELLNRGRATFADVISAD